ncbi:MAG: nucleotide exchange factor GrpE [bacterium]
MEDKKTEKKVEPVKKAKPKKNLELEKAKKNYDELNEKFLRVMAEMQNVKRRSEEEISKLRKFEGEAIITELLSISDDFERALLINGEISDDVKKFLDGFEMIYAALIGILKSKNVEEIVCINTEFDPNIAMAVLTEKKDDILPGVVIDVLQKGYTYNGKVIRPAMVKVSE